MVVGLRVEPDPHTPGVRWRFDGHRQFCRDGTWYVGGPHYYAETFPSTPERIAMWIALELNPTLP